MRVPGRGFLRFLVNYKIEALLVLVISGVASALSVPLVYSLPFAVLVVIMGTYLTYKRRETEETARFLRDISRLVDDFDNYCFQAKAEGQDFRIVKLLGKMKFPRFSPTTEAFDESQSGGSKLHIMKEEGLATIDGIREIQVVFQLWLAGLKYKLRMVTKMGNALQKYDLYETIAEFVNLCNNYLEKVIDRTIWTGNRANIEDRPAARSTFNVFRENFSHFRDRANTFLKDFHATGAYVLLEVKAMKTDLEV